MQFLKIETQIVPESFEIFLQIAIITELGSKNRFF